MHTFISYIHENKQLVDRMAAELQARGVRVWLDREQIRPGENWKRAIAAAIEEGSFFIACFSIEYSSRDKTHMNEELALAVEELRRRRWDRIWFIPVLLNRTELPSLALSPGQTLRDLQWVDLSENWDEGIDQLLLVISGSTGRLPSDLTSPSMRRSEVAATIARQIQRFGPVESADTYNFDNLEMAMDEADHLVVEANIYAGDGVWQALGMVTIAVVSAANALKRSAKAKLVVCGVCKELVESKIIPTLNCSADDMDKLYALAVKAGNDIHSDDVREFLESLITRGQS